VKITYATVRARTREIGTLRAIGFGATPVAVSVLVEAALLGAIGALLGATIAWLIFDGREMRVWGAFRLRISPALWVLGLVWALVTSLLGGLFPALRPGGCRHPRPFEPNDRPPAIPKTVVDHWRQRVSYRPSADPDPSSSGRSSGLTVADRPTSGRRQTTVDLPKLGRDLARSGP